MVRHGSLREERARVKSAEERQLSASGTHSPTTQKSSSNGSTSRGGVSTVVSHRSIIRRPGMDDSDGVNQREQAGAREVTFSGGIGDSRRPESARAYFQSGSEQDASSQASHDLSMSGLATGSFLPAPPFPQASQNPETWGLFGVKLEPQSRIPAAPIYRQQQQSDGLKASFRQRMDGRTKLLIEHLRAGLPQTRIPRRPRPRPASKLVLSGSQLGTGVGELLPVLRKHEVCPLLHAGFARLSIYQTAPGRCLAY